MPTSNGQSIPYAESTASGNGSGTTDIYDSYYFEAVGPNNSVTPVELSGALYAAASLSSSKFADLSFALAEVEVISHPEGQTPATIFDRFTCLAVGSPSCSTPAGPCSTLLDVTANTPYQIQLHTNARLTGTGAADAISDPFLQIDAGFLATNPGYSLEFSDGIVNAPISSAPLPPALPMFGASLVTLGAFAWRKSRLAKAA